MTRAERRKQEREQKNADKRAAAEAARKFEQDIKKTGIFDAKEAVRNPFYLQQVTKQRLEQRKEMEKNGITKEDLKAEYNRGYAAARRDLTVFTMRMFYSAIAISLHRLFKFGEARILRVLDDVQWIMTEEICTDDIMQRCRDETGIDITSGDYDD
jgi:hypothetical protein